MIVIMVVVMTVVMIVIMVIRKIIMMFVVVMMCLINMNVTHTSAPLRSAQRLHSEYIAR